MAREFKIKPMANRMVNVNLDLNGANLFSADAVHETALDLLEAAYQSGAIQMIDEVMKRHRDRYVEVQSEWRLLDQVWRDLRLALGYDDSPNPATAGGSDGRR